MLDFAKFTKYSKPGPRYTSYPTALEFSDSFGYDEYIEKLKSQDSSRPLSLYFHLPFCKNACYFCGCNVVFTSKEDKMLRYMDYLKRELKILSSHVNCNREVIQMHFGGGTPTFFSAAQLEEVIKEIKSFFPNFVKDAEISCEIDPRHIDEEQMKVLSQNGFNRVSFGLQDFNEKVQSAVHRIQPYEITKQAMDLARKYNMVSVNVDLIYGLPFQTLETFKETLALSLTLNPDRFAVFNYAHVPWMKKTMRKIDETTLPLPDEKLQIMQYTIDFLTSNGYKMIGMDHFAKPEDELFKAIKKGELHRNFQGYTTKGGADLIGVGLTSIGEGVGHYAQNFKDMREYEDAIDAGKLPFERGVVLNDDDMIRQYVIMELMSNFKLDIKRFEKLFNIDFKTYFADALTALKPFEEDELLSIDDDFIKCSETGTLLIRNIAMPFDAYMKKHAANAKTFSKTV
ncbi:MAG: oxygen-independent coproporphyrinogen III oxidase [Sulfurimonas sp. RIFOXYD12_FULL_33_39]|uniref:oxygen-independent coproporphyrinogen III oxidase n=1 Tax=unclassified Sulfurimonas TaxID=2623549 RepID=UPI0008BF1A26|nr:MULTISPECIES: oxygen-independent coproporphyrinogen III oxidase [unclassified Sulfurimonas]OHE07300.1 MAG: oxygen-independent coproporphyrinogen III oxidase [Sulfurimonas sp. RIFCSPLOWO2_12_FULL_34_6]OHE09072.1 MAG: oxygen-independent coproporphyrinogen III oxidase [Sulfurimonas sp. RIFOXYD12_FULL_33_39]OHE14389.1 MAG: oxygen-independent coproporphyrinogen III oxidase [Sulfurimonas sp. RIFOXYD2_FULL_34_21]